MVKNLIHQTALASANPLESPGQCLPIFDLGRDLSLQSLDNRERGIQGMILKPEGLSPLVRMAATDHGREPVDLVNVSPPTLQ